jgi:hypothetical protein
LALRSSLDRSTDVAIRSAEGGDAAARCRGQEFEAFLYCGILAPGFLCLRCADCAHEKLVTFSCKKRGFCASCGAGRMADTAAHLVDHVILRVPVRQSTEANAPAPDQAESRHPSLLARLRLKPDCSSASSISTWSVAFR